ncbi:hypothetical protein GQ607_006872 [Colletotrichum asianum]|uniref:Uncharacterized protein n=1 Tax=Colletotrichum asianum TaxID=702518 RepID=A0A8H3WFG2_9PEZI|nr:hypothetical protein GQ607_006872 [Colletotrichum asianum]
MDGPSSLAPRTRLVSITQQHIKQIIDSCGTHGRKYLTSRLASTLRTLLAIGTTTTSTYVLVERKRLGEKDGKWISFWTTSLVGGCLLSILWARQSRQAYKFFFVAIVFGLAASTKLAEGSFSTPEAILPVIPISVCFGTFLSHLYLNAGFTLPGISEGDVTSIVGAQNMV